MYASLARGHLRLVDKREVNGGLEGCKKAANVKL